MAWRDSRRSRRRRLLFFSLSVTLGIHAVLVALGSLSASLQAEAVRVQSKGLLGADLVDHRARGAHRGAVRRSYLRHAWAASGRATYRFPR